MNKRAFYEGYMHKQADDPMREGRLGVIGRSYDEDSADLGKKLKEHYGRTGRGTTDDEADSMRQDIAKKRWITDRFANPTRAFFNEDKPLKARALKPLVYGNSYLKGPVEGLGKTPALQSKDALIEAERYGTLRTPPKLIPPNPPAEIVHPNPPAKSALLETLKTPTDSIWSKIKGLFRK